MVIQHLILGLSVLRLLLSILELGLRCLHLGGWSDNRLARRLKALGQDLAVSRIRFVRDTLSGPSQDPVQDSEFSEVSLSPPACRLPSPRISAALPKCPSQIAIRHPEGKIIPMHNADEISF